MLPLRSLLSLCVIPLALSLPYPEIGYVTTRGQKFNLDGLDYIVAGTNAYWLAQRTQQDVQIAFKDIVDAGFSTVRTWGWNDVTSVPTSGTYYQLWQNGVATFNTGPNGAEMFDYVVAQAKAHGLRLIVPLTNNWSDYGGMDVYVSQLNPGGTHDTFYTDPTIIAAYKHYISEFVGRYKDEPTIMAWELANEPRCGGSTGTPSASCTTSTITNWASEISTYIKSIDQNHLVALGDEGWFQRANPPTYPYAAGVGISFDDNIKIPTLDFGTFHSYPESWGQTANETLWGEDWITSHAAVQKTANKPVILEEFGVTHNQSYTYSLWYKTILTSGLTGDLIWQAGSYFPDGPSWNDGFAVYPNDTTYQVQRLAAIALTLRG